MDSDTNFTHSASEGYTTRIMDITVAMPATLPTLSMLLSLLAGYLVLCHSLRFRRINNLQKRMGYTDRASLARMTNNDAQLILKHMIEFEFPKFYTLALQFAIFKVFFQSFPSMIKLVTQSI